MCRNGWLNCCQILVKAKGQQPHVTAGDHSKPETLWERTLKFKFALRQLDLYHRHDVYRLCNSIFVWISKLSFWGFFGKTELASRLLNWYLIRSILQNICVWNTAEFPQSFYWQAFYWCCSWSISVVWKAASGTTSSFSSYNAVLIKFWWKSESLMGNSKVWVDCSAVRYCVSKSVVFWNLGRLVTVRVSVQGGWVLG